MAVRETESSFDACQRVLVRDVSYTRVGVRNLHFVHLPVRDVSYTRVGARHFNSIHLSVRNVSCTRVGARNIKLRPFAFVFFSSRADESGLQRGARHQRPQSICLCFLLVRLQMTAAFDAVRLECNGVRTCEVLVINPSIQLPLFSSCSCADDSGLRRGALGVQRRPHLRGARHQRQPRR